jgi:hypothetical protein
MVSCWATGRSPVKIWTIWFLVFGRRRTAMVATGPVLHDLSPTMSGACERALPGVSHFVCHQHLARDVGEDLYEAPQAALCKRLRTLKLQYRLKEQRRGQSEWLRQRSDSPLGVGPGGLAGGPSRRGGLGRYARPRGLVGFSLLDSRLPERRPATRLPLRSVPVVLASPLVRAGEAVDRLLSRTPASCRTPQVLRNFQALLQAYRNDPEIRLQPICTSVAARPVYPASRSPAAVGRTHGPTAATAGTAAGRTTGSETCAGAVAPGVAATNGGRNDPDGPLARIVLKHLDKYWGHLHRAATGRGGVLAAHHQPAGKSTGAA